MNQSAPATAPSPDGRGSKQPESSDPAAQRSQRLRKQYEHLERLESMHSIQRSIISRPENRSRDPEELMNELGLPGAQEVRERLERERRRTEIAKKRVQTLEALKEEAKKLRAREGKELGEEGRKRQWREGAARRGVVGWRTGIERGMGKENMKREGRWRWKGKRGGKTKERRKERRDGVCWGRKKEKGSDVGVEVRGLSERSHGLVESKSQEEELEEGEIAEAEHRVRGERGKGQREVERVRLL